MRLRAHAIAVRFLEIASAILCVIIFVLWIRSYFIMDGCGAELHGLDWMMSSAVGAADMEVDNAGLFDSFHHDSVDIGRHNLWLLMRASRPFYGLGFRLDLHKATPPYLAPTAGQYHGMSAAIPFWFGVVAAGLPLSRRAFITCRKRRRKLAGRCLLCGYDLRVSVERCPECGAVVR